MRTPDPARVAIYEEAIRASVIGLVVNILLGTCKLVGGIVGSSFALLSDAVNSIGDSLASLIVVCALHLAQRPADREHPYGHSRAEAIAASNVAVLMVVTALLVLGEAVRRMQTQHHPPEVWTLWIAGANTLIKEGLYRYKLFVGQKTGSTAVIVNAWDHRSDALCSLAVLLGLAVIHWGGGRFLWVDGFVSLAVGCVILWNGSQLFRRSASELMDLQADDAFVQSIHEAAESVSGVRQVETLWVRKSGLEFFADIHVEVDPLLTIQAGHEIGHRVKDRLLAQFSRLRDVLVHLEPYRPRAEEAKDERSPSGS